MKPLLPVWVLLILGLQIGCTTTELSLKNDYQASKFHLADDNPKLARDSFHKKEENGFITNLEKSYLELLYTQPDTQKLLAASNDLERRQITFVSQEAKYFFYKEAEDGYFPAEHEVIMLHLITGLAFAKAGDPESARVEASKAAFYLQGHFSEQHGDFDDPSLRMILAALWLYCGEWEHARVDFRVAAQLSKNFSWAKAVAEKPQAPKNFFLILRGFGPDVLWKPKTGSSYLTGLNSIMFDPSVSGQEQDVATNNNVKIKMGEGESTLKWYDRHQDRNTAIRDVLLGSKYMIQAGAATSAAVAEQAVIKSAGAAVVLTGVALGLAVAIPIMYVGAEGNSSDLVAFGFVTGVGIGKYFYNLALKWDRESSQETKKKWEESLDTSRVYRFVRFLPDRVYARAVDSQVENPVIRSRIGIERPPLLKLVNQKASTQVSIFFLPK